MRSDICLKPSEVEAYNELLNRLDKVFSDKNSAFADGLTAISKDIEKGNISSPEELVPRMKKLLLKAPAAFSAAANAYNLSKAMFSDDPVLNTTKELCKMGGSAVGTALGAGLATALGTTMTTPLGAIAIVGLVALGSFFGSEGAEKIIDSILDNLCVDPNVPRISISSPTVLESDSYAVFNISLAIPLEIDLELDVKTGNGTAKAGKDFEAVNDKIVIKAGETSYQYKVKIIDDDIRENTEYFTLKAQSTNVLDPNDFGYYGIGIANIKDDDEDVLEVQVQDATCIETDGKIEFTITLNKALEKELKLKVHTVGETATADEDFEDKSGTTITIPPNTTIYKYTIPVASDGIYEGKEQFGLFLVNDGKYEGNDVKKSDVFAMATGTIIDFPKEECPKNSVPNFGFSFDEPRNYFPSYSGGGNSGGGNSGGGWRGGIGGGWSGSSITYVPTAPTKPSLPHIPEYECHYEPDLNSVLKVKLPSKAQSSNSKTILASSMSVINSLNLISSKDLKSNNNNKQTTLSRPNDTCNDDTCYANKEDKIYFDMNGDGFKERMLEWLKDDEAILVNDINNNGLVDNGLEIVGNHYNYTNSPDSFSLLKEFDTNKDGVIDDKDDHNLALWIDANQNGITDEGELIYLKDANSPIRQIELNPLDTLLSGYDKNHDFKIDKNDGIYNYIYYEENSDNSVNLYIYGDENIKEYLNGYDKNLTVNTDKGIKQVRNIKFYKDIDELDLNDTVNGTSLNDHIIGNNTSNKLYGNAGNDIIEGYDGDDILDGGEGSDKLIGGKGNDILIGGRGNDYLEGGANNDTYIFKKGDGVDVIYDESGYDVVVFEEGITKEDLVINSNGVDLNIAVKSNSKGYLSNQIIIKNFYSPSNMIELVKFSDGSFLSPNDLISMISTNSNDQIYGTYLDETIDALNGDDKVYAGGGNDIIIGNKGDDMLYGGSGNDTYIYTKGDGRDTIFDSSGNDTLILKNISKNDVKFIKNKDSLTLYIDEKNSITIENYFHSSNKIETIKFDDSNLILEENDIINEFITDGDDIIIGTSKNDTINGLDGNDTINGLGGNDTLIGGNGNDKLYGGSGNDILIGGSGDDYLSGGSGDDIYEYNLNDGNDTIYDSNGNDTLKFGSGINRENISFKKYRNDLSITIKDTNETIKITNFFTKENTIETFKFSDETVLTNDEIAAMFSIGMSEKDTIYSSKNATLKGEKGDDIYVYQRGDGKVIVDDSFIENNIVINSGNDTLRLVDIRQNDVKFASYGNDLIILIKDKSGEINNENAVIIKDWKDPLKGIENIEFSDGTISVDKTKSYPYASGFKYPSSTHFIYGSEDNIITGQSYNPNIIDAGAGNDIINAGYKNDILIGGKGADILNGGDGDDIYVYNLGDGQDTIYDTGGNDAIKFGDGISQNDILIRVVDFNLYIGIKEDGVKFSDLEDRITIRDWMKNPNRIEKFIFQDGSMLSYNEIIAKAGTDENDIINTFPGNDDVINALDGDDIINSNDGDDIIDGGAGDDIINGGDGNDTYIFKPNMGRDQITDTNGIDRIKVVGALTINDVSYAKVDDDLVLYIKEPGQNELNFNNGMVLKDWFKSLSNRIEFIEFEDGRVIKPEDIIPFTNQDDNLTFGDEDNIINALGGNDIIYAGGGNDIIDGGSGNDILYGGSGNDIIDGGSGNDILYGGSGDDTYLFGRGSGIDIINEYDNSGNYGGNDTLEFKEGITPDDLVIMYDTKKNSNSYDLIVGIKEKGKSSIYDLKDRVTLINWRYGPRNNYFIENFKFSDGTIWNYKDIQSHIFTDGDDTIKGFYRNNNDSILTGGKGNDRLEGYGSNDTYIFNRGDEKDTIYDTGGNDTLKFGEGISREDLIIKKDKNDIKIYVKNSSNQNIDDITDIVTIKDWYNSSNKIENIILNDGTKIDYSFLFNPTEGDDNLTFGDEDNIINALGGNDIIYAGGGNDIIDGGSGNDILYGGSGNDIIDGGSGNDILYGGSGDDTYLFGRGSGIDIINEYDNSGNYGGNDTLEFKEGITPDDLVIMYDTKKNSNSYDLIVGIKEKGKSSIYDLKDRVTLINWRYGPRNNYFIENFKFSDGTIWNYKDIQSHIFTDGDDTIKGFYRNNNDSILTGGKGNDRLEGYGSNDTYIFNRGDEKDTIYDTGGNDTLKFGEGISREDLIIKKDKNDIKIYVKNSSNQNIDDITDIVTIKDWYNSSNKIENIILNDGTKIDYSFLFNPTEGDDNLTFGDEDNIINALGGNDIIYAGGGNDIIDGGSGNDILYGGSGNDIIDGGSGNDILYGGSGDDTYLFGRGSGIDIINEYDNSGNYGGNDTLEFKEGITPDDLVIMYDTKKNSNSYDLIVGIKEKGKSSIYDLKDRVTLINWRYGPRNNYFIENFKFSDGTIWNYKDIQSHIFTDGDDTIKGFYRNNNDSILTGGKGNDRLEGYGSNDTYIFNRGDEKDTIYDTGGNDTLKFGEGISREDLIIKKDKNDIKIYVKNSSNQNIDDITDIVTIKDWYNSSNKIENIILNDGTKIDYSFLFNPTEGDDNLTFGDEDNIINALGGNDIIYAGGGNDIIDGGSGNDILYGGSGNDIIDGGSGNDILYGGSGDDTYLFGRGSGIDIINEYDNSGNYGGNDTLEFKEGITPDDLVIMYDTKKNSNSYDLIVGIKEKGKSSIYDLKDRVTLINWRYGPRNNYFIENFKFSDGTIWNYKDIQSHIFTDGDDTIKGFYRNNNDSILTGGKGNDRLEGYGSNDTYIFNRGDEKDTIYDTGGNDTLKFGEGISREDVVFWSEGNNLIFDLGNGDMVTVINHSNTASNSIEKIELNNGYYIDKNSLDVAISEMKLKSFDNGIVLNRENILKNGALKDIISSSWKKDNDFTPPLVLDLNSNNTTSINLNNSYAYFDYDNDGVREKTAWIEKGDALLAVDLNNNGLIDNGSEIFGNYFKLQNGEFAKDGYEALAEFDSNKDGKIDKHDDHFSDLLVWKDSNQNGISEDGELVSLKSLGITEIKLPKNKNKSVLENGNVISNSSTFIQNGKEKTMNDVWFKIDLNEAKSDISNDILYDNDFEDSKIDNTLHVDKIKILSQAGIKEIILRSGYTGISINGTSAITSANNGEMSFENVWYRSDNTDTIYDEESNSYISGSGTVRGLDDAMKDNDTLKNSVDEYKNSLDLAFDDLNSNMDNILKNWALNDDFMSNISSTPPIVLDLNQNGITSTKLENSDAYFDYQNNGRRYKTSWIEKEDAFLGIDINNDGVINNAYELFGTFSKLKDGSYAKDGYEALKEFDTNGDGVIDQNDENFEKLVAWQDKNGDGKSEKDEVKSLKDLGVSSISLNISDDIKEENGNKITASSTFIKDDKEYVMRDIWFNVSSKQSIAVSDLSDSDEKKISVVEAFRGAKLTAFQRSNPYEILKALKEYENIKYSTISKIISKELFGKEMPTCHIMYQALNQKLNRIIANESNPNEIALSINLLAASLKRDYNFAIHKVGKNTLSNPIIKKLLEKTGIKFSFNENGEIEGVIGKNYFGTKDSDNFNFSKNSEGVIVNSKSGNDLIIGSSYNDELNGGLGNDIIYAGDGIDVLRGAQGDDLLIGGDKSTIYEYYLGDGHDTIVDEGGRDILAFSYLDIENLSIEKDGNNMKILVENPYKKDKIIGSITIIDGFTSGKIEEYYFKDRAYSFDEMFKTVSSNSTYYFNSGDGIVSIDDKGGVDKLIFGKGVNFKNIIVIKKENDLEIALNLPNRNYDELLDKLRIKNFFTQTGRIESFIFDNGVILNHEEILSNLKEIKDDKFIMGDDNDNVLNGTDNANIINGKKGNDILNGGFGDDNYIYEKDSGKDIINDTGGNDKLVFGLGITRKDLISKEVGGDLVIALKEEGVSFDELKNSITIKNWKNKDNKIESVMYDNGIVYNIDTLLNTAPTLLSKSSTYTLKNTDTVTGNIGAGDIDGDTLSYKVISNLNNSTINIDKEGNFIYKTGKTVKDTILVEVSDGALNITKELNFNNLGYVIDTNDNITIEDNKLISNSLEFNADIKDVDFLKDKDNLVIKSPSSSLTLKDYFINDKHQIPVINFKDTSLDINSPLYPTKKWWQINPSIKLDNKGVIISYEDNAVLKASSKDDTIISLNSNADIKSFDKDDFIYAGGKNTIINSGDGNDTVIAKEEGNKIYLGDGDDYILSGLNAYINSGDGNDTLLMLGSNSKAYLEDGNDKAFINSSNSFIDAGNGDDTLITKGDNNTLIGSNGNDTYIIGKDANNTIIRDKEYVNLIDGGNDTLILNDIDKSSVEFKLGGSFNKDLIINYSNSNSKDIKTLTIQNQTNKYSAIENINLDGTMLGTETINKIIQDLNSYSDDNAINLNFNSEFKNNDIMQIYNS